MQFSNSFEKLIPKITDKNFESWSLELFAFQAEKNAVYRQYINNLGIDPKSVKELEQIPFLPIEFFKVM